MHESDMYHDGSRRLQDQFETRRLADRLEVVRVHTAFSDRAQRDVLPRDRRCRRQT